MKKLYLILFCFVCVSCVHVNNFENKKYLSVENIYDLFFSENHRPTGELIDLLVLTGDIKTKTQNLTANQVLNIAQKKWLRAKNQSRFDLASSYSEETEREILEIFNNWGFKNTVLPKIKQARGALLLGALFGTARKRANFIKYMSKHGYDFETLWVLSGERVLRKNEKLNLDTDILDERQMMRLVAQSELPEYFEEPKRVKFVESLKQPGQLRARTSDTLLDFLKLDPVSGDYFLISNQPFGYYQYLVAERILRRAAAKNNIRFLLAAEESGPYSAVLLLDMLARILYEFKLLGYIK